MAPPIATYSKVYAQRSQATLTVSRLEDLTVSAILDAMPPPPTSFNPAMMVRSRSEAQDREKALPSAPEPVTRTSSEPPTYLSLRGPPNFGDPRERSEQREAARRAAEEEERAVQHEEAARQARIKAQRAAEAQRAQEEEMERRAQLEHDLARKAAARAAKEDAEREEEERRVQEREERRRRSAEKRAEDTRRVEGWMREEQRKREEIVRAEEELKRRAIERREAAREAAAKRRRESRLDSDSVLLSGWVTVQNSDSVAWRRRYFQLTDALMRLYHREAVSGFLLFLKGNYLLTGKHRMSAVSPRTSSYSKPLDRPSKNGTRGLRNYARSLMHLLLTFPMA
jgi:hypothetical protein